MDQLIKSACENHLIRRPMSGIHKNLNKIRLILNKTKEFYKMRFKKLFLTRLLNNMDIDYIRLQGRGIVYKR